MQIPLEVAFKNVERSDAVEARIREKAQKLERFAEQITSCRVVVEAPHHHQHHGHTYDVRIDIHIPGQELVVSGDGSKNPAHADVYVAIRDAFDAAVRQLDDRAQRLKPR
ncbi:MAG TPA: HPF/RaiA family ribosome-associated protein [Polyangiales bacterium]